MRLIFLCLILSSVTAIAESELNLQKIAELRFMGETEVEKETGGRTVKVQFSGPIDRVVVNNIDNLFQRAANRLAEINDSEPSKDGVMKEIYLDAGNERLNCYVNFKNGAVENLVKCAEIYPKEVSGYGNY
jgi:hypothetical protein